MAAAAEIQMKNYCLAAAGCFAIFCCLQKHFQHN